MIRLICQKSYKMSVHRNILVHDPAPFDMVINDIPSNGLKQVVSPRLHIPYLSKYKGSMQELREKVKYQGTIIGDQSRVFLSIPTALKSSEEYYYVHYFVHTGSPYTTLTHQALCCLSGKKADDPNLNFDYGTSLIIGGNVVVQAYLSNPNLTDQSPSRYDIRNANVLGLNFLRKFQIIKLEQNRLRKEGVLELIL